LSQKALVADPAVPVSSALRRHLEAMDFEVKVVHSLDEAVERIRAGDLDLVVAAATSSFDGETLCQKSRELLPSCPVVLVYPPDEEDPEPHAARAGADAWLVGPVKRTSVVSCVKAMMRIRQLQDTVEKLEADLRTRQAQPATGGKPGAGRSTEQSPSGDFEFFKKFLLMEVKRSRRYRYPVAFLLVALDHFAERVGPMTQAQKTTLLAEALSTVSRCVRDIDLAVPFGDERFLIFLPHTAREGALIVAGRLRDNLAALKALPQSSASVGVAAFEPGTGTGAPPGSAAPQVSFGSLMKDATEALRRAQARGGNAVDAGERKTRDRISLG
jgi:diguanylate cyclase (GGDEF)-like protein